MVATAATRPFWPAHSGHDVFRTLAHMPWPRAGCLWGREREKEWVIAQEASGRRLGQLPHSPSTSSCSNSAWIWGRVGTPSLRSGSPASPTAPQDAASSIAHPLF